MHVPKQLAVSFDEMFASLIVSLWAETHAQASQVSVGEGEEQHEPDEPGVVVEEDGQVEARLNVAQHEERYEGHAGHDEQGEQQAVFVRLRHREEEHVSLIFVNQTLQFNVVARSFQCSCSVSGKKGFGFNDKVRHSGT